MRCYDEIKQLYLAGDMAAASALCEDNRNELIVDAAGCTLFGVVLMAEGRQDEAVELLARATEAEPESGPAWHNHGAALRQIGRHAEAAESFKQAVLFQPADAESWFSHGDVLSKLEQFPLALDCLDQALFIAPDHAGALAAKGFVLHRLKRYDDALTAYEAALALKGDDAETWLNMGVLCQEGGAPIDALSCYDTALALRPDFADGWSNRAKALQELGRLDQAVASFDEALRLRPDDAVLTLDRGMCKLLGGDFAGGWADYEVRLRNRNGGPTPNPRWPIWRGEPIRGRKLLVTAEQGYGDTFQFMRYVAVLAGMGAEVTLHVPRAMLPVLASLRRICAVTATTTPADRFDFQIALLSLPHRLGTDAKSIPGRVPYLSADPALETEWGARIGKEGFRIGIAWQGNPAFRNDGRRSIPLQSFLPLTEIRGVRLISLQRRDGLEQLEAMPDAQAIERLPDHVDKNGAFLDTAAVLANLDLVIASDSAIAHLAGALGRPVWLALNHVPDWRWQMRGQICPWYPTMRLFRQQREGDWGGVFAELHDALKTHLAALSPDTPMIPCSLGELIDKITILEIKSERIVDIGKLRFVQNELSQLRIVRASHGVDTRLAYLTQELKQVNEALWDIEDGIRLCEAEGDFTERFIAFARAVYVNNDRRAELKREINLLSGSRLVEQKSYAKATG